MVAKVRESKLGSRLRAAACSYNATQQHMDASQVPFLLRKCLLRTCHGEVACCQELECSWRSMAETKSRSLRCYSPTCTLLSRNVGNLVLLTGEYKIPRNRRRTLYLEESSSREVLPTLAVVE